MRTVWIRRYGNVIQLSAPEFQELQAEVCALVQPELTFKKNVYLVGKDAINPMTGQRDNFRVDHLRLYHLDDYGRLSTNFGFMQKLYALLEGNGYAIKFIDVSPPRKRPNCYVEDWENLARNFTLEPGQDECLAAMVSHEGGMIEAAMGFGKSYMMAAYCFLYPHAKFAISTRALSNVKGLKDDLSKFFPHVGVVSGAKKESWQRIVIYSADSLHHFDGDADFFLADEGHDFAADKYANIVAATCQNTRNFCFSAEYKRFDNAQARLEGLFGPMIFKSTYEEAQKLGRVLPIKVLWVDVHGPNPCAFCQTREARYRHGIFLHEHRNEVIADTLKQFGTDEQILVLTQSIEHALHLHQHLPNFSLCYGSSESAAFGRAKRAGIIDDGFKRITRPERIEMQEAFKAGQLRHVIATDVWSTGVSFDQLQIVARADARNTPKWNKQGPGRASRKSAATGKEFGLLIDTMDYWDNLFHKRSCGSRAAYRKQKWEQLEGDHSSLFDATAEVILATQSKRRR